MRHINKIMKNTQNESNTMTETYVGLATTSKNDTETTHHPSETTRKRTRLNYPSTFGYLRMQTNLSASNVEY